MTKVSYVLDSSALLCLFGGERGADLVVERLDGSAVSAVNFAEVVTKLVERKVFDPKARADLDAMPISIVSLDVEMAEAVGVLRASTRRAGLSLGDRCCLALAQRLGAVALTTDRAWAKIDIGVRIEVVR